MGILESLGKILEKANQSSEKAIALLEYLQYFGYILKDEPSISEVIVAIRRFQEQFGISETDIGAKTVRAMEWPRCAVKESLVQQAANPARWGTNQISYFIRSRDTDLPQDLWDSCMKTGFDVWSSVTPLKFFKVDKQSEANFVIDVGQGRADDFDGPSGTLAWFQLVPQAGYRGQIFGKFDIGETWVADSTKRGIILTHVAAHEFGHGLGLMHSNKSSALMAPFYSPTIGTPQSNDDISRIQALYGKNVAPTPTPVPVPTPTPTPGPTSSKVVLEINGRIDSITIPGYRITKMG